jgi:hypothetical protein
VKKIEMEKTDTKSDSEELYTDESDMDTDMDTDMEDTDMEDTDMGQAEIEQV